MESSAPVRARGRNLPSLTVFRPSTNLGSAFGGAISLFSCVLAGGLIYRALSQDVAFGQLPRFLGAGFFITVGSLYAYWTWGCRSLSYAVDRNALSIRWGGVRQIVPLDRIERLIPGHEIENPHIEGVSWVGHHVGRATVETIGDVLFYSTHRTMREVLYVQTADQTYGISVPDQVFFAQTIQSNQARGPLFGQRQAVHRWGIAAQSFWLDPRARLMAAILIASFFVMLGYVLHQYPGLGHNAAGQVQLRFPALGGIARVGDKSAVLDIPRSGIGFLAVNLVLAVFLHSWERMVGYVLLLGGIAVQFTLLIAAIVAVA